MACASNVKELKVVNTTTKIAIDKKAKPRPLNIQSPKFIVITAANFEQYREKLLSGNLVIYGLSEADYKLLLKNQSEYKRYISQQGSVIVFYEANL